jgi:hypothetical protein
MGGVRANPFSRASPQTKKQIIPAKMVNFIMIALKFFVCCKF